MAKNSSSDHPAVTAPAKQWNGVKQTQADGKAGLAGDKFDFIRRPSQRVLDVGKALHEAAGKLGVFRS